MVLNGVDPNAEGAVALLPDPCAPAAVETLLQPRFLNAGRRRSTVRPARDGRRRSFGQDGGKMRIAVLSDMHAVAEPTGQALRAAEAEGFDALVILGDLLTYGVDPRR